MISYNENPNVGLKVVTTVEGDKEYRHNCKYILDRSIGKSLYYKIGRDCFQIEGKWYRKDSAFILFDHEKKTWLLKKGCKLIYGVVNMENGSPILGYFSPNTYNNVSIYNGRATQAISNEIIDRDYYLEDINSGLWYPYNEIGGKNSATARSLRAIQDKQNYRNKGYNIEDNGREFVEKVKNFKEYNTPISKEVRLYARFLNDRTFGAEIELAQGFIPDYLQNRFGIVMCRDGSISGGEAVTVPMSGAKGVQTLKDIAMELKDRAIVDINCSYHLHLGNVPQDRVYLCALYVLAYRIQDEVFQMFPYYKTNPTGIKKKNYCQKLAKMQIHPLKDLSKEGFEEYISEVYNRIFEFLSDGVPASSFNNKKVLKHPIAEKWNRPSRYRWLNLSNMIFSDRRTAEFRIHHATLNAQKMTLWLFICNAIVKYAELNQTEILTTPRKISLTSVLSYYSDQFPDSPEAKELSNHLIGYMKNRKEVFALDLANGDKVSNQDAHEDKTFVFDKPLF